MVLEKIKYNMIKSIPNDYFIESLRYFIRHKKIANFKNPKTFNEKLGYLKLYRNPGIRSDLCDKYLVKNYVRKKIGGKYVLDTLYITSEPESIPFDKLPDSFIIKATHGSGWNIIVEDKKNTDFKYIIKKCRSFLSMNYYYLGREYQYKNIEPQIMIENLLKDENGDIPSDYKFFSFNSKVKFIQVDYDRANDHKRNFYDLEWNKMDFNLNYPSCNFEIKKPENLSQMIEISKVLSKGLPFARIDLYSILNDIYFGEITLTPENNLGKFMPAKYDKILGEYLSI
tara:strand:+ start:5437 stop:6288 length:852 start_codon:yes stop_codon:yes gene_type:complete